MKTKHLFTFFVLLALISSSALVNKSAALEEPNKTQNEVSQTSQTNTDGKTLDPKKRENPKENTSPTQATIDTPKIVTPPTTNNVKSAKADSDEASPLPLIISGLSGLLHLLGIAGMVWAYLKINQLSEKNRDSRSQIKSLMDRLNVSEQKQKSQGDQLKTISSEIANVRNLTSKVNAIEQQATQEKYSNVGYASPSYNQPSLSTTKAAVAPSPYPFLDTYRQSPDNFKNQYAPKAVSEDADNLQKRWSGDQQEIILGEERQGNYWLFNEGSAIYLIPSPKLRVNDKNMRTVGSLFDCNNYIPGSQSMTIVRPAVVSSQLGANERWKLEQKGVLEFY
jgi:hypothetical protein